MSLIIVTSSKGSPGATTTAVGLAAVWPRPAVLVECDPTGGDLPYFLPAASGSALTATRGVVSLAAATRTHLRPSLDDHAQVVAGGLPVLVGPASRAQAAALGGSWPKVIDALAAHGEDVIVDRGRYTDDDDTRCLITAAQLTVLVCRPMPSSVAHARQVLTALGRPGDGSRPSETPVAVVVVGEMAEVRDVDRALASHTPGLVAGLADDPAAARGLCGQRTHRLDRSRLVVSARVLARQLDRLLGALPSSPEPMSLTAQVPVRAGVGE